MACGGCESTEKNFEGETAQHPCYNPGAHDFARMHIPVAPRCNISCNYCNRKFDCLNESRPGVTSEVLTPEEAFEVRKKFKQNEMKKLAKKYQGVLDERVIHKLENFDYNEDGVTITPDLVKEI